MAGNSTRPVKAQTTATTPSNAQRTEGAIRHAAPRRFRGLLQVRAIGTLAVLLLPLPERISTHGLMHNSKENTEPNSHPARSHMPSGMSTGHAQDKHSRSPYDDDDASHDARPQFLLSTNSADFLPSVNFDDLHSSIATASGDFKQLSEFPVPGGRGIVNTSAASSMNLDTMAHETRGPAAGRGVGGPRPARAASVLRRQSTSTRQSSMSSTTSTASANMDPPSAPLAMRTRRQSQYPPVSGSSGVRAPRKSIGPGVIDTDTNPRQPPRRRPSLAASASTPNIPDSAIGGGGLYGRSNNAGPGGGLTDASKQYMAARAARTKSLQPPSRQQPQTLLVAPVKTPEHGRSASFAGRSPGRTSGQHASHNTSSTNKRMSVMPGIPLSTSHATGLGARTVSPTDARRMKRLSMMPNALPNAPPMPATPPTPQPEQAPLERQSSRSPSMLPQKPSTPSSSRTTPDINRKSYSSGLSVASNMSLNTARTSTGSLQPRMPQATSNSRLPTPKTRNVNSSAGGEEEEVPPVPAIPKAYESPKESPPEQPFFTKRKPSVPFDSSSIHSTSTNDMYASAPSHESTILEPEGRRPSGQTLTSGSEKEQKAANNGSKKRALQPLRLPPLNLLPLSTPTATRIAALPDPSDLEVDGRATPPRRTNMKTPSTPMTASRASFFSKSRHDDNREKGLQHMRSSSSIHQISSESTSTRVPSSSSNTIPIPGNGRGQRQATVSPFISSSLPRHHGELSYMPRSKTSGDFANLDHPNMDLRSQRLTGPRAQKLTKPAPKTAETPLTSSPDEPTTPSAGSSLRRKLSIGWKRSTSKSNISLSQAASDRDAEYPPAPPKHNDMPPPRLPASATMGNLHAPSPSSSLKSAPSLEPKSRKTSGTSLRMFGGGHDRTRSDSWGLNQSPKKEGLLGNGTEPTKSSVTRTTSSALLPAPRALNTKASSSSMKAHDVWTLGLDRDDMAAEEEMRKLASKRKETEQAARTLDALRKRATPKERVSPQQAIQMASLNIYERGEVVDYKDVYFCGTHHAAKHVGDLANEALNFGYDDERGDYSIVTGDHLSYRYEVVDILGKGSFGQVVRCVDHKTGGLVAVKIIRNKKRFHQQALVEVNILKKLREWVRIVLFLV